jgi:hypothetical protein
LREIEELRETDDPNRLILHDRLQHRDVSLQELDLGLDLAGERTPPSHENLPPTKRDMVRDSVGCLKRFDALRRRRTPCRGWPTRPIHETSPR